MAARAFIVGCAGPDLTAAEHDFLRDADPWGLILFARNVVDRQDPRLVSDFRDTVGRSDAPVLIDQEGGRVQRLRAPVWTSYPTAEAIGRVYARDRPGNARPGCSAG